MSKGQSMEMSSGAVERGLAAIREEMAELRRSVVSSQLPQVLTMERAATELSVGATTLRAMVKRSQVLTVFVGKRRMVPASEIRRIATPEEPRARTEKRPAPSGLQDPETLRRRRR